MERLQRVSGRTVLAAALLLLGIAYLAVLPDEPIYHGDTAKFQFVGRSLGTPHTTGYPTYLAINHLFTRFFPWGSLAFKANLLSALFGLAAAALLFRIQSLLGVSALTAGAMTLAAGFCFTFWSQSVVAEVYSLHLLFVCAVLYLFLKWHKCRQPGCFYAGWLVYALSFGNHLTTVTLFPALAYLVLSTDRSLLRRWKTWLALIFFFALGALQYLYIIWRSQDPSAAYLEMRSTSLAVILWFLAGGQFRSLMFAYTPMEFLTGRLPAFFVLWMRETLFLAPLALYGYLRLPCRPAARFLGIYFLCNALYALNYRIDDYWIYLLPNWVLTVLLASQGLERLMKRWPLGRAALAGLTALLCFAIGWNRVQDEVHGHPRSAQARLVYQWLEAVGRHALIISDDYHRSQFAYYYLIGQGWQQQRNIYLMHHFSAPQIRSYLVEGQSFVLPEQRLRIPAGLTVYAVSPVHLQALREAGLQVEQAQAGLHRVYFR